MWLKRDVRIHDHGPLFSAIEGGRPFVIMFLYEPDQVGWTSSNAALKLMLYLHEVIVHSNVSLSYHSLSIHISIQLSHPTVHGSHLAFVNEGLAEFEDALKSRVGEQHKSGQCFVTRRFSEATAALEALHGGAHGPVVRLMSHQETGHGASYARDRRVKSWCRRQRVVWTEVPQSGVVRGLRSRADDETCFARSLAAFEAAAEFPDRLSADIIGSRVIGDAEAASQAAMAQSEACLRYPGDRPHRGVRGGEAAALATLRSFLLSRGMGYSGGISSPSKAWHSCSRLSPYLAWGHLSLRRALQSLATRQQVLRAERSESVRGRANATGSIRKIRRRYRQASQGNGSGSDGISGSDGDSDEQEEGQDNRSSSSRRRGRGGGLWLKSLAAFSARLHWRAHFMQKFETEVAMEFRCQSRAHEIAPPLRSLRITRQAPDAAPTVPVGGVPRVALATAADAEAAEEEAEYLAAWMSGRTGFPLVGLLFTMRLLAVALAPTQSRL